MASFAGQACAAHDGSLRVIASRLSGRGPPPHFRSFDPTSREEATPSYSPEFMGFYDEEISRVIDAGRADDGGNPPATMTYDGKTFDSAVSATATEAGDWRPPATPI